MESTVTAGELKIIEANVRGIGNKEPYVKSFLQRRKKKADIFCIVEHKSTQNKKFLEQLASGSYRVGASYCRRMGGPGGGVALLVHERLTGVQDAENKFKNEFESARSKGVDIAAIELNLKPKDCQMGLFVFGIYRRPPNFSQLSDFIDIICELVQKVSGNIKSTAIFTGDFNINNNKEGQNTRSNKVQGQLIRFQTVGYKLTHTMPSHLQGSTLNNFLLPTNMRYSQRTIKEGLIIPNSKQPKPPKEPDHLPIQIIVALENPRSQNLPRYTQQHQLRGNLVFNVNTPSTSTAQHLPGNTQENADQGTRYTEGEDGVITILDSDDEEPTGSQSGVFVVSSNSLNQTQSHFLCQGHMNVLPTGHGVSLTRVKIEGEPQTSRVDLQQAPKPAGENTQTVTSNATYPNISRPSENAAQSVRRTVISSNSPTFLSQSSSFQRPITSFRSQSSLKTTPLGGASIQQPNIINVSSGRNERNGPGPIQRNEFVNPSTPPSAFGTSRPLQPMSGVQSEIDHSNIVMAEESVPIVTTERTYREVRTIRPEPSSRPTPYPQVQGITVWNQSQLERLERRRLLKERELKVLTELSEIEQQESRILEEMNNTQ